MTTESTTKEHPILFSTEMVKAILEGRKTMTRRVVKPQPYEESFSWFLEGKHTDLDIRIFNDKYLPGYGKYGYCPYGQVGDRLWVRETWWQGNSPTYGKHCIVFDADKKIAWHPGTPFDNPDLGRDFKKRPSIFMPRGASRITLEITNIRVERQLDITLEDVIKEGFGEIREFNNLFLKLNPHLKGENPWVWVIEFKVVNND